MIATELITPSALAVIASLVLMLLMIWYDLSFVFCYPGEDTDYN